MPLGQSSVELAEERGFEPLCPFGALVFGTREPPVARLFRLERRPRLELGKSGVAIRRLVHFGIRRVVKELGGRGEGRTLMPEGAGS